MRLPQLKAENEWLKEVPSQALQQPIIDLDRAFQNKWNGHNGWPIICHHKTENRERIVILRDIIKESMIQSEIRHLCVAQTNVTQNEINPYEQPSIDVLDVRIESTLLTGSNLENISDGGEWEWDK